MRASALVVDDDASVRFVLGRALESIGIEVTEVDDGAEVIPLVQGRRFDVLVIDLYMPGMNGFELLRQLRRPPPNVLPRPRTATDVPVLVVSAEGEAETVANARRLGADAQLPKPIDLAQFERTVRQLLRSERT